MLANSTTQTGVESDGQSLVSAVPSCSARPTVLVEYPKVGERLRMIVKFKNRS
jgi:hypothetical protein